MAVKICPKCGESNKENATSCIECGESLLSINSVGVSDKDKRVKIGYERCPHCDKKLDGSPLKCPYCGTDLSRKSTNRYYAVNRGSNKGGNVGIYILSVLIPLVGLIIGAIWLSSDDKKEEGGTAIALAVVGMVLCIIICAIMI